MNDTSSVHLHYNDQSECYLKELITVHSENHMKLIYALCAQNTASVNVKATGT
jgi:hypothetical protein